MEFGEALESLNKVQPKGEVPKQAAVLAAMPQTSPQTGGAATTKTRSNVPFVVAAVLIIALMGGSATISIKVIDTATKKTISAPRTKTVNYTTLNMQDNIEEATEEMVSDLPGRLMIFWKG